MGFPISYGDTLTYDDTVETRAELIEAAKLICIGVSVGLVLKPSASYAFDIGLVTNSTKVVETAERVSNTLAGLMLTQCTKISDPKTKAALLVFGFALGWSGKYLVFGK